MSSWVHEWMLGWGAAAPPVFDPDFYLELPARRLRVEKEARSLVVQIHARDLSVDIAARKFRVEAN